MSVEVQILFRSEWAYAIYLSNQKNLQVLPDVLGSSITPSAQFSHSYKINYRGHKMNTSCMLIASILHQQFKSWTCQLCEAQMNPCKFNKKSLRAQMNLHSKAPAKDVYMKKKYGWKLAAKRVNTDWDNGTKPLLILYFEHVPFAQSALHLFCSKEEQKEKPSTLSFCLAVPAKVKDYDMTETSHSIWLQKDSFNQKLK